MKKLVKIGLVQMKTSPDPAANLEKAVKMTVAAAGRGARIICLPELFRTPYFPQQRKAAAKNYAETISGKTTRVMSAFAKQLGAVLIVPIYEKTKTGKYYNTAVVFETTGRMLGIYRKVHIPHDPGFYEKNYFTEGNKGYKVFKTKFANLAVLICYDQWYPEAARAVRLAGAEIIFYPTAIGDLIGRRPREGDWHEAWELIQRSHAIANSICVASVNRVGIEGKTRFWGQSFVADAFGKILKRASQVKEEIIVVPVDLGLNQSVSEGWGFLRNRRPETYKTLCSTPIDRQLM